MTTSKRHLLWQLMLIAVPGIGLLLLFLCATYLIFLPEIKNAYFEQRRESVRQLTTMMISSLEGRNHEVIEGKATLEEAQKRAIARLRTIRYGVSGKEYYWITHLDGTMLMHPYLKKLEGNDMFKVMDAKGKPFHDRAVEACLSSPEGGFVEYQWQVNDDTRHSDKKISYFRLFKPWNWIVGTGVYVEDIEISMDEISRKISLAGIAISALGGILVVVLGFKAYRSSVRSERATDMLRYNEERFRSIFDNANDAIILLQNEGGVDCNDTALRIFGCSNKEEFMAAGPLKCFPKTQKDGGSSEELFKMRLNDVMEKGERQYFDWVHLRHDGTAFDSEVSLSRIVLSGEAFALSIIRDVTERNQLRERLHQSEKMDAIGHLAGGVAHDFNNMLGGIIGAAELMEMRIENGDSPKPYIKMILESAERASALTDKLLAFARKHPIASSPVDANEPLRAAISLLENTVDKRINVHCDLFDGGLAVVGDPSQLQGAWLNLLINASHAMPEGGDIYITSRVVELDKAYCDASSFDIIPGAFAEIEIRDTGSGIEPEILKNIFEPFYTTKGVGKGTGLGLAAVMGTVQQHRGAINVYSELGVGTSFHIALPLSGERATAIPVDSGDSVAGSGTILVVDDESVMRQTAGAILENLGYDVILAEDGEEGLVIFSQDPGAIDLVILDMVMPQINGHDCFMRMREIKAEVKVILSSGFSREDELVEMKEAGLNGFIRKPFRSATLSKVVKDALDGVCCI